MTKYVTFLRGINVGGHKIIKMADLRGMFESFGFASVETYIQSGNVIFEAAETEADLLETKIEQRLQEILGYKVTILFRSELEMADLMAHSPFKDKKPANGVQWYVTFLPAEPDHDRQRALLSLQSDTDAFEVRQREVFTVCDKRAGKPLFSNNFIEKTLGLPATTRNWTVVSKIAERYFEHNSP